MKLKKSAPFTEEWQLYEKGKEYNYSIDLYNNVNTNERFYRGDQWDDIDSGGLPKPVFNIFKRIIGYFSSSIMQNAVKLRYTITSPSGDNGLSEDEANAATEKLNRIAESRWKRSKMDSVIAASLIDAALSGDGVSYTYWDPDIRTGQAFTGDFVTVNIDNTNVFFGDPNAKDVQKQPYILIAQRETVESLKAQAKSAGATDDVIDKILPDSDTAEFSGDMAKKEISDTKCVSLIKLWKDENGRVFYRKSVKSAVIKDTTDTLLTRYPIAYYNWTPVKNRWHGQAVGTGLTENQIFINKGYSMVMKHMMDTAFSKVVYDSTMLDEWSNRVGEAIAVNGPVENVAKVISPGQMQAGMLDVINMAVANTKEFLGATDTALGDVKPTNTSAIIALQNSASIPLENVKRDMYAFVEDIGLIWLDFMLAYYDDKRFVSYIDRDGEKYERFDFSKYKNEIFNCNVNVGASSYWSDISSLNTLDSLLKLGKIDTVQYLERIPDGLIPDKEGLIKELRAAKDAAIAAEGVNLQNEKDR